MSEKVCPPVAWLCIAQQNGRDYRFYGPTRDEVEQRASWSVEGPRQSVPLYASPAGERPESTLPSNERIFDQAIAHLGPLAAQEQPAQDDALAPDEADYYSEYMESHGWISTLGDPAIGQGQSYAIRNERGFRLFVLGNDEDARVLSRAPYVGKAYLNLKAANAALRDQVAEQQTKIGALILKQDDAQCLALDDAYEQLEAAEQRVRDQQREIGCARALFRQLAEVPPPTGHGGFMIFAMNEQWWDDVRGYLATVERNESGGVEGHADEAGQR